MSGRLSLATSVLLLGLGPSLFGCDPADAPDAGVDAASSLADASNPELDASVPPDAAPGAGLPVLHPFDPERAARGATLLGSAGLGTRGLLPRAAIDNLWVVWGTGPRTGAAWLSEMEARYGVVASPEPNDGLPLGFTLESGNLVSLQCLVCHAGRVAGAVVIGAANGRFQLQAFYEDLERLSEIAGMPASYPVQPRTGAPGANDAFGLGMALSKLYGPEVEINTEYGFQDPPAWWTIKYKPRIYTDASGQAAGYRTMMATLLAFGMSFQDMQAKEADFADLHQYLLSLEPPAWPFGDLDEPQRARGRQVFESECSSCHGVYDGAAPYPNQVIPLAELGTDPERTTNFGETEALWINASWFGENAPMTPSDGYLAPPLVGVWASAPYFHNGSVPDLLGVLDSSQRPERWARTGDGESDYDPERVGWRFDPVSAPVDSRRGFDTTKPGLSNAGHTFGDGLSSEERSDLLEYLRGL